MDPRRRNHQRNLPNNETNDDLSAGREQQPSRLVGGQERQQADNINGVNPPRNTGIPPFVEIDNNTVVSGIDGTVMARSQLRSHQDSRSEDNAESSRSEEDAIVVGLRQFRDGYRRTRSNTQGDTDSTSYYQPKEKGHQCTHSGEPVEAGNSEEVPLIEMQQFGIRHRQDGRGSQVATDVLQVPSRSALDSPSNAGVVFSKLANQLLDHCILVVYVGGVAVLCMAFLAMFMVRPRPVAMPTGQPSVQSTNESSIPTRIPLKWLQVGDDIDGEGPGAYSGRSVALSSDGTVLAIGARRHNISSEVDSGCAAVYVNAEGVWTQRGKYLDAPAAGLLSVALSADGTIVATGAREATGAHGSHSGQVQVYRWTSGTWQSMGPTIDGDAMYDEFGSSVALSDDGTIMAAEAFKNGEAGVVRVFAWAGTEWNQRGNDLVGAFTMDRFGFSIALSSDGSIVACGTNQWRWPGPPAYAGVYRWSGSTWIQHGSVLKGSGVADLFGISVSLSGDGRVVAVGAGVGSYAAIYRHDGTDWSQIGQTIRGVTVARYGRSVSLSFDGSTVAVGAIAGSTVTIGAIIGSRREANSIDSGLAVVYKLSPNRQKWVQVGQELIGEAAGDDFGGSVAISDNGARIAIGAPQNDGHGEDSGHVRVFDLK